MREEGRVREGKVGGREEGKVGGGKGEHVYSNHQA